MAQVIRIGRDNEQQPPDELPVSEITHEGEEGARLGLALLPGGATIPVYNHPENGSIWYEQLSLEEWKASQEGTVALHNWHIRARVRIRETTVRRSVDPWREHTFQRGDVLELIKWANAGNALWRKSGWWTSYDIDGAFILDEAQIEVLEILDETSPFHSREAGA